MAGSRNARRAVHVVADVGPAGQDALAGVEPHANPDLGSAIPRGGRQGALSISRGAHRGRGPFEHDEERVALRPDFGASGGDERVAQQRPVAFEDRAVALRTQRLAQERRALDVAEQERDRADGTASRAGAGVAVPDVSDGAAAP